MKDVIPEQTPKNAKVERYTLEGPQIEHKPEKEPTWITTKLPYFLGFLIGFLFIKAFF